MIFLAEYRHHMHYPTMLLRRTAILAGLIGIATGWHAPAYADSTIAGKCGTPDRIVRVDAVSGPARLRLSSGAELQLANIWIPEAVQAEAMEVLSTYLDRKVQIYRSGTTRDRYGRLVAQLWTVPDYDGRQTQAAPGNAIEDLMPVGSPDPMDRPIASPEGIPAPGESDARSRAETKAQEPRAQEVWIQAELVRSGLALVKPLPDNRQCVRPLLKLEALADRDSIGLWRDKSLIGDASVPAELRDEIDQFRVIEGKALSVQLNKKRAYINFGPIWRKDFTAIIEGKNVDDFVEAGVDFGKIVGKLVRLRGWLEERGGPAITLDIPEQLELLEP